MSLNGDPPADQLPDTISLKTFRAILKRYPSIIARVSSSKSKASAEALNSLDEYRYETLPATLDGRKAASSDVALTKDELVQIVRWKVTHGTFRPTLLPLVKGNSEDQIHETTSSAFSIYTANEDISKALKKLCELKGIGPATASLILSIFDSKRVPFLSDEAFRWVCWNVSGGVGKGWMRKLKYTDKEYVVLREEVAKLRERLGVSAIEVEQVAWVLGMEGTGKVGENQEKTGTKRKAEDEVKPVVSGKSKKRALKGSA